MAEGILKDVSTKKLPDLSYVAIDLGIIVRLTRETVNMDYQQSADVLSAIDAIGSRAGRRVDAVSKAMGGTVFGGWVDYADESEVAHD